MEFMLTHLNRRFCFEMGCYKIHAPFAGGGKLLFFFYRDLQEELKMTLSFSQKF